MTIHRAVIVAAGMGRRLNPYTDQMPKCLVPVRGKPMLTRALDHFRAHGLSDFVVVRGYLADVLEQRKAELEPRTCASSRTPAYQTNNILQSLFRAEPELHQPFVFTYSDIVFASDVMTKLMAAEGDICLVVDRDYAGSLRRPHRAPLQRSRGLQALGRRLRRRGRQAQRPHHGSHGRVHRPGQVLRRRRPGVFTERVAPSVRGIPKRATRSRSYARRAGRSRT